MHGKRLRYWIYSGVCRISCGCVAVRKIVLHERRDATLVLCWTTEQLDCIEMDLKFMPVLLLLVLDLIRGGRRHSRSQ